MRELETSQSSNSAALQNIANTLTEMQRQLAALTEEKNVPEKKPFWITEPESDEDPIQWPNSKGKGRDQMWDADREFVGEVYVGETKNGTINGRGRLTRSDGSVLEGYWHQGTLVREEELLEPPPKQSEKHV